MRLDQRLDLRLAPRPPMRLDQRRGVRFDKRFEFMLSSFRVPLFFTIICSFSGLSCCA
jgi:hypothetical protein